MVAIGSCKQTTALSSTSPWKVVGVGDLTLHPEWPRIRERALRRAYRLVRDENEDVVQEAAAIALRRLVTLREMDSFEPWFLTIVTRAALRHQQRQRGTVTLDQPDVEAIFADDRSDPETILLQREQGAAVRAALGSLSPDLRRVCELYYFRHWKCREIAAHLGVPVNTVKTWLFQVRQRLEPLLAEHAGAKLGVLALGLLMAQGMWDGLCGGMRPPTPGQTEFASEWTPSERLENAAGGRVPLPVTSAAAVRSYAIPARIATAQSADPSTPLSSAFIREQEEAVWYRRGGVLM